MVDRPTFENAPGLTYRKRGVGWEARWRPRADIIKKGYPSTPQRLWTGVEPTEIDRAWVSDRCNVLQREMLLWGQGGIQKVDDFDGTIKSLCESYQTDRDSGFRELRFRTREHYVYLLNRLILDHGSETLSEIQNRSFRRWYEDWSKDGRISMGHAMVTICRIVFNFGKTLLQDAECTRLAEALKGMKFKDGKPRNSILTAEHVVAIRAMAHRYGYPSIAFAQALQFDLTLRQRDVIGEWVPMREPGVSDVFGGERKWIRGLRWDEVDQNMILRHTTSKRLKEIVVDLRRAPMVMEEIALMGDDRPTTGPMIVNEATAFPFIDYEYRRQWRAIATEAGIPKEVRNMDSRAGAITEALQSGASLDSVRKAATHSDISMTQRYSRGDETDTANVMDLRAKHRNKK